MTYYELNKWDEPLSDLEAWDRHPEVIESYVVPSESRDIAHLVRKVECLKVPFAEADVVADKTTIYVVVRTSNIIGGTTKCRRKSGIQVCANIAGGFEQNGHRTTTTRRP